MTCLLTQVNPFQVDMYKRIQEFSLDQPEVALPFSKKLAKNNGWSTGYTQRVIEEYKKFIFLAVTAGHIVTPSDQVDQAWHLHLTYSRSYWEDFCPNVLQTPLHHDPTRGGSVEHLKYTNLYDRTLDSYQKFFGQIPPADIWSTQKDRFGRDTNFVRVNTQQNWFIPKPSWDFLPKLQHQQSLIFSLLFTLAFVVAGCQITIKGHVPTRFNGSDPDAGLFFFSLFYFFLSVAVVVAACGLQWYLRLPETNPSQKSPSLDPYEIAYLAGGTNRVIDTVITSFMQKEYISISRRTIIVNEHNIVLKLSHPVEKAVAKAIESYGSSYKILSDVYKVNKELEVTRDHLCQLGLIMTPRQSLKARLCPAILVMSLVFLGGAGTWVAILRGHPAGFHISMTCIIVAAYSVIFWKSSVDLSRYGDQFLLNLRSQQLSIIPDQDDPRLLLSFALIGAAALSTTIFPELRTFFIPPASASGGGGGCGGGGCGGGG